MSDGNCYRAAALGMYGMQDLHMHVRLLTAVEMVINRLLYDDNAPRYNVWILQQQYAITYE